jgi:two-component SAPR family response regulator
VECARIAKTVAAEAGAANLMLLVDLACANCLLQAGALNEADACLHDANRLARGPVTRQHAATIAVLQAWLAHKRRDWALRDRLLTETIRQARDDRCRQRLRWHSNAFEALLPVALQMSEIAPDAKELARTLGLAPSNSSLEDWPWPIKVYTLGAFRLIIGDCEVRFSRKVPKLALALLQVMIANGGQQVPQEVVLDALWPEQPGDAAHAAFKTTLHRLRRLLGDAATIKQSGGRLTLDAERCWVDAFAFERMCDTPATSCDNGNESLHAALALYRGSFLAHEDDIVWAGLTRDRLRRRYIQAVSIVAADLESAENYMEAADCYSRGLEVDCLVEPFYQGLMRCYDRLHQPTEVSRVYRRLKQTLSVVLGAVPSSSTEHLYRQLS